MASKKSISLVVPVYNEKEIIEETVRVFLDGLSELTANFELIIIDDASCDGTAEIAESIAAKDSRVRLLRNRANIGSGGSLWLGFKMASKELIVSNFADRPFNLSELGQALPLLEQEGTDFIIAVRKDRSANSLSRKLTSYVNFLIIRLLFNPKVDDFQFAQIYKREILNGIELISSGTFVPPELIIRLVDRGYRFKQFSCQFHKRTKGRSKCGKLSEYVKTAKEIVKFWNYRNSQKNRFSYAR